MGIRFRVQTVLAGAGFGLLVALVLVGWWLVARPAREMLSQAKQQATLVGDDAVQITLRETSSNRSIAVLTDNERQLLARLVATCSPHIQRVDVPSMYYAKLDIDISLVGNNGDGTLTLGVERSPGLLLFRNVANDAWVVSPYLRDVSALVFALAAKATAMKSKEEAKVWARLAERSWDPENTNGDVVSPELREEVGRIVRNATRILNNTCK